MSQAPSCVVHYASQIIETLQKIHPAQLFPAPFYVKNAYEKYFRYAFSLYDSGRSKERYSETILWRNGEPCPTYDWKDHFCLRCCGAELKKTTSKGFIFDQVRYSEMYLCKIGAAPGYLTPDAVERAREPSITILIETKNGQVTYIHILNTDDLIQNVFALTRERAEFYCRAFYEIRYGPMVRGTLNAQYCLQTKQILQRCPSKVTINVTEYYNYWNCWRQST